MKLLAWITLTVIVTGTMILGIFLNTHEIVTFWINHHLPFITLVAIVIISWKKRIA